jgi:hypothetical protein
LFYSFPQAVRINKGRVIFQNKSLKIDPSQMEKWIPIWIATLNVSEVTSRKLALKHGIDLLQLQDLLICNSKIRGREVETPVHGKRFLIYVEVEKDKYIRAYLDLVDFEYSAYSLRTAQMTSQIPILRR